MVSRKGVLHPHRLAYAPVGAHTTTGANPHHDEPIQASDGKTLILAAGFGWLYGIGCVVGPFYGVGVGITYPGGVLAGAGGGIGVVIGIGMGAGAVWGSGRGVVAGYTASPPMHPPLIPGMMALIRSKNSVWGGDMPELELRTRAAVDGLRKSVGRQLKTLRRPRINLLRQPKLGYEYGFIPPLRLTSPCISFREGSHSLRDRDWVAHPVNRRSYVREDFKWS